MSTSPARPVLVLTLAGIALVAADFDFRSARIEVRYDEQFHRRLRWLEPAAAEILAFDPEVQEFIEAGGKPCDSFRVDPATMAARRIQHPEFGPALEGTLRGTCGSLERRLRLLLPDRFPDAVVFENDYRNTGSTRVQLGRVVSQRLLLDRRLAEPRAPSWELATFQGGAYAWGRDYELIWLKPGFRQSNFQGLDDRRGPEGEGGGIPLVDAWSPKMGVALAHLAKTPEWVWLPVEVRPDGRVEMAVEERPLARFKQAEWLAPGETFQAVPTAVIFHRGDFHDALRLYGELLRARGVAIPRTSPPAMCEPYWKTWGFGLDFAPARMLAMLPELQSMGIRIANVDDGWFDFYGDWNPNRSPSKFPGGEADVRAFVRRVHDAGFKTNLWWYPIGVSPESRLAREHPELLVRDESGGWPLDDRKQRLLCPAFEPALRYIEDLLRRFVSGWDFDGVYVDSVGLTAVPPCFNPAHEHRTPLDSFRSMPAVFERIDKTLRALKPEPWLEVCICAMPHSPYNMPFYPLANASDPVNPLQMRRRIKVEKAIRGPTFCVGDCYQVPMNEWQGSSVPESFESAFGTGAQVTTFYGHLSDEQRAKWRRWFLLYRELGLSSGEYLNLYDLAFDAPEGHAVRKGNDIYYGFFAPYWPRNRRIQLRGLDRNTTYEIFDYANSRALGTVSGEKPFLNVAFKDSLLIRARPAAAR